MSQLTLEQEAIVLNAVITMVDDMVNHVIFCPLGLKKDGTNLTPQTSETLRQFAILLRDFLSPVTAKSKDPLPFGLPKPPTDGALSDHTTLFYLKRICDQPIIGTEIAPLAKHVRDFADWLDAEAFVPNIWFSNIGIKADIRVKRIDFIRMGGDIGKHNFLRLGGQAKKLIAILDKNHVQINEGQAYAALPDCWDWFHENLFAYHASTLAEFLNNIRYAIRDYVSNIAQSSYRLTGKIDDHISMYTFDRPEGITSEFAWAQYYSLLDKSRRQTTFPRFTVTDSLKQRY